MPYAIAECKQMPQVSPSATCRPHLLLHLCHFIESIEVGFIVKQSFQQLQALGSGGYMNDICGFLFPQLPLATVPQKHVEAILTYFCVFH